jgi:hypothetical protein
MNFISPLLITLLLATPAMAVKLFRYRGAVRDGGTLEYIFETDEVDLPQTVTKESVAEIAAEIYHPRSITSQIGALGDAGVRTTPIPFWLVSFSDAIKEPLRQMFFVVVLPNEKIVEPSGEATVSAAKLVGSVCMGLGPAPQ